MASIDIFNANAFEMVELTTAVNRQPFVPSLLGSMGMFATRGIRTKAAAIEEVSGTIGLVATSERGAPPTTETKDKRKVHYVEPPRLAKADKIYADEIQNIRAFGSETELKQVQAESATRLAKMRASIELTKENLRLGAVQGIVYDSDGSTVIIDWYTLFNISQDAEIDFDLDAASPASGVVRKACTGVVRATLKGLKLPSIATVEVVGLAGDNFFDDLTAHPETRATFLNQIAAASLREGNAYAEFRYGGIRFINYRGTDDGTTVGINTDKCKFFPVAPGMFETINAPGEFFDTINLPGLDFYALTIPDRDRNAFVGLELYSYPLQVCTRPGALQRARRT